MPLDRIHIGLSYLVASRNGLRVSVTHPYVGDTTTGNVFHVSQLTGLGLDRNNDIQI